MSILVTGSTGTIGSLVLAALHARRGALGDSAIHALTRSPDTATVPDGVVPVGGDLADLDRLRAVLAGTTTLFLLVPNVGDEMTQAIQTLALAHDAGIERIVYLSVFRGERFVDVPHFVGKYAVELMIRDRGLGASVLRPAYFMQNDLRQKPALDGGVYGMPLGGRGISMVDGRDIADAAAIELIRRERNGAPLPAETFELVGPEAITGASAAETWATALARPVRYGGDDLDRLEAMLRRVGSPSAAYDLRLMMRRYQEDGAVATEADLERLTTLLGRPPRSYRAFAAEAASHWQAG